MSGPGDWLQFYHQNLSNTVAAATVPPSSDQPTSAMMFVNRVSDATAVSTTSAAAALGSSAANTTVSTGLNPEGRVGKPVRRRSRASRRTPTTLLNTDTTNFRAMVQQFTGGPTPPFASSISHPGAPNFTLGFGGIRQSHLGTPPAVMMSQPSGYLQQQQFYQHHHNPQPLAFPSASHGDGFLQRLSGTRPANGGVSGDGFLMDGGTVSSQIPSGGASADSSNESNGGNGGNGGLLF